MAKPVTDLGDLGSEHGEPQAGETWYTLYATTEIDGTTYGGTFNIIQPTTHARMVESWGMRELMEKATKYFAIERKTVVRNAIRRFVSNGTPGVAKPRKRATYLDVLSVKD